MWCRSSLSGRADALYVVNDALGSFLLRASEVIDQVPMSACVKGFGRRLIGTIRLAPGPSSESLQ